MPKAIIDYESWNDMMVDTLLKNKRAESYEHALELTDAIWSNLIEIIKKEFPNTRFKHIDISLEIIGKHADKAKSALEHRLETLDLSKEQVFPLQK